MEKWDRQGAIPHFQKKERKKETQTKNNGQEAHTVILDQYGMRYTKAIEDAILPVVRVTEF